MMDRPCQPICSIALLLAAGCCAAVLCGLASPRAAAQPPASTPGYVLLRNGNVLRGQAKQDGAYISVEESNVAAIRLPQTDVLCWAPKLSDLYAYRVQHRKPHSLTARFEDLRWCIQQGLVEIAETELANLQTIAPNDRRIVSMTALLESAQNRTAVPSHELAQSDVPHPDLEQRPNLLDTGSADSLHRGLQLSSDVEAEVAGLPRELMVTYTKRIQPLLINRCGQAGCHGGVSKAVWQLEHFGASNRLPANFTRQNLAQLLHWIHDHQVDASPLLVRAGQPHGGTDTAPLGLGDEELRHSLHEWVAAMAARQDASAGGSLARQASAMPMFAATSSAEDAAGNASPRSTTASKPTRLPRVEDPFNPADFNRIYHPQ